MKLSDPLFTDPLYLRARDLLTIKGFTASPAFFSKEGYPIEFAVAPSGEEGEIGIVVTIGENTRSATYAYFTSAKKMEQFIDAWTSLQPPPFSIGRVMDLFRRRSLP